MTIEDFHRFADTRRPDEKWELIDGEPVMSASPTYGHQKIIRNLIVGLCRLEEQAEASWEVIPGIGVLLSEVSAPEPDLLIRPRTPMQGRICSDAIVAVEVLSPTTAKRDLAWKRQSYASLASLDHYVVVAQSSIDVLAFDRSSGWQERRIGQPSASLSLPSLNIDLPLRQIYAGTGL